MDERLISKPLDVIEKQSRLCFNKVVRESGIGMEIPPPPRKDFVSAPLDEYHPELQKQISDYLAEIGKESHYGDDEGARNLRPISVRNTRLHFTQFLDAAVRGGIARESLTTLGKLVTKDVWKPAFSQIEARSGKVYPVSLSLIARTLIAMAKHLPEIDAKELSTLRRAEKVISRSNGLAHNEMGKRNRDRLAQFDDPENIARLILLPEELLRNAKHQRRKYDAAMDVMTAAAISLLLYVPLRPRNLAQLEIGTDFFDISASKKEPSFRIDIPAAKTKNSKALTAEIKGPHAESIRVWLCEYRELIYACESTALFLNSDGGQRDPGKLGAHISARIFKLTGIRMTAHMFRHLAAKLILQQKPEAIYQVVQVLNHKKIETTKSFYCSPDNTESFKVYHDLLATIAKKGKRDDR